MESQDSTMRGAGTMLESLGGEAGCQLLSKEFYARVATDPLLRPLFPGKSLRCATEEFAAFLIQFLGGDESQTQYRWRLSLRGSHARFRLSPAHRSAWLKNMLAALKAMPLEADTRGSLKRFFAHSSAYVIGAECGEFRDADREMAARWQDQCALERAVAAIACGFDSEAIELVSKFLSRPTVFVGLLARMMKSGRVEMIRFAREAAEREPALGVARFNGRTLLHHAAGAGCIEVVAVILKHGVAADVLDSGGHTALYRVANECPTGAGPEIVRLLVKAGADVDACGGVTRSTALHAAARRGHAGIAQALIECGAATDLRDVKGITPLQRAVNCRRSEVERILQKARAPQSRSRR
jgi:truncated hemoglobin YjbI